MEAPNPYEYGPYYAGYVKRVGDRDPLQLLRRQREELLDLLRAAGREGAGYRYAPGKWSLKEVVGHLIDVERVFVYRAMAIARGDSGPLPGFDENSWVAGASFDHRAVGELAAEYCAVRAATVAFFTGLTAAEWKRFGVANGVDFSVRALAFVIAGHEGHHLEVLRERYLPGIEGDREEGAEEAGVSS